MGGRHRGDFRSNVLLTLFATVLAVLRWRFIDDGQPVLKPWAFLSRNFLAIRPPAFAARAGRIIV